MRYDKVNEPFDDTCLLGINTHKNNNSWNYKNTIHIKNTEHNDIDWVILVYSKYLKIKTN